MARRDLSKFDASTHAASELEYIIRSEKKASEPQVPTVTPEQAMKDERMFKVSSNRDVTRVLFISRNTELLNPTQQSLDGYIDISDLFDEVHIMILRQGIPSKNPALRVAHNVWIYTVSSKFWWLTPKNGVEMASEQLEFASGFRPDLIVARDPFESAILAYKLGKKYGRPTQLHVLEDYSTSDFTQKSENNFWRLFLPIFTIPLFQSVRTMTATVQNMLQRKFVISDVNVLPKYQNYESLIDSEKQIALKDKYKPLIFFILFIGKLTHQSNLHHAIDATRFVLRNPRVGMLILGDGPEREGFKRRARLLGIEKQVIFETKVSDIEPFLKSANLLIVTDTDADSEELVLKGAASGIPMVMARTEKREDTFTHGNSAFLCNVTDVQALTDRINDLLNDVSLRSRFKINSQSIIRQQFHTDPGEYLEAYRTSIEQAFFVGSEVEGEDGQIV
ncbi:MAG: glycosyltransferase [Candidatus Nomurabacteria bacterium]|nr:MAG: glycosyltransferase [Candidatus Nomurabacteria bacterium]